MLVQDLMTNESLQDRLKKLKETSFFDNLIIKRGIEKEFFRVDSYGFISKRPHPISSVSYTHLTLPTILLV